MDKKISTTELENMTDVPEYMRSDLTDGWKRSFYIAIKAGKCLVWSSGKNGVNDSGKKDDIAHSFELDPEWQERESE
jgi:hypothetical protein